MTQTIISCPKHGDIYVQDNAGHSAAIEAHAIRPLHADAPQPRSGERCACPFCGRAFNFVEPAVGLDCRHVPDGTV